MKPFKHAFLIALLFLLAFANKSGGQDIVFKRLPPPGEVPMGLITGITQDSNGYMWFAGGGLFRYDGYNLKTYLNDPFDLNSLGSNQLESICIDKNGIIWIGTQGYGLDRFDPVTEIFTHYRHSPDDPKSLIHNKVTALTVDHEGILWIGTHGGLDRMDTKTGKISHFRRDLNDPNSLSCDQVRSIYEDKEGTIWLGTGSSFGNDDSGPEEGGLNKLDKKTGKFTRYLHDPKDPQSLINNKVCGMLEDSRGNFWVGTAGDGLHTMDRSKGIFERHLYDPAHPDKLSRPPLPSPALFDQIRFIAEDAAGYIWIGSISAGMNRYDPVTKKVIFVEGTKSASGLPDNTSWSAFTSRDGVFWVSTLNPVNNGWDGDLYYKDPIQKNIPLVNMGPGITAFLEEDSTIIWLGTNNGLIRQNRKTGVSKNYSTDILNKTSISHNYIASIFRDRRGNIWIGTQQGLNRYNNNTDDFTRFMHDDKNAGSLVDAFIFNITEDNKGFIWLATQDGVDKLDQQTNIFTHYKSNPEDTGSLSNKWTFAIHKDLSGDIWIGVYKGGGINRLDPQTGKFKQYLLGKSILCFFEDADSVMWVGSDGGFFRYSRSENAFSLFVDPGKNIKTESLIVLSITEDNKKNLWMGTSVGILKLNANRNEISIYGSGHGVNPNNLQYSAYKSFNGRLFFGSNTGYYNFFPDSISNNRKPPQLNIVNFRIGDELIKPGANSPLTVPVDETMEIRLGHTQNIFSFDFTGIHFTNPENNKHLFMLENYDNSWRQSGTEHIAYYYNVPPGHYIFRVKASSSNNLWAEKSIAIIIAPPWWRSWWAYVLYGLLIITVIFAIDRFQKQRVIAKERERTKDRELAQAKEIEKAYGELKTTQSQLIHAEKMASLGELTAGIAHEIQNPLNFVNNFSEVNTELIEDLEKEVDNGNFKEVKAIAKDIKENEKKINHHGKRADAIVKGMLQHSQSGTGIKEPTDINALADEYFRLAYHGLRAKDKNFNAALKTDFDVTLSANEAGIGKVPVISQDIGRVLLNLYNNAFFAVSEKQKNAIDGYEPTVTVSTKKIKDELEIRVADNGNGIPEKVLDKVFQPFFTTKQTGQGTGLGLSLSYDIIKAHHGKINIRNTTGEGVEFIITLPMNA